MVIKNTIDFVFDKEIYLSQKRKMSEFIMGIQIKMFDKIFIHLMALEQIWFLNYREKKMNNKCQNTLKKLNLPLMTSGYRVQLKKKGNSIKSKLLNKNIVLINALGQ